MVANVRSQLILWTGQKRSGKTTQAGALVQTARGEGFDVAGLLAPSIRLGGESVGYDVIDLQQGTRAPLARRKRDGGAVGRFTFLAAGLELGRTALGRESTKSADLIVVDEFGPWELDGGGWRKNVDELLAAAPAASFLLSKTAGAVLLIVRDRLVGLIQKVYSCVPAITLPAGGPDSARRVIELLRSRRQTAHGVK